jgi:hypothetical protein
VERLRITLLCGLVVLLWCLAYGRTSGLAWSTPVHYYGDGWLVLATLKAAQDGHVAPFQPLYVPELGAPFEANWNDLPDFLRQHKLQLWIAGQLCRALGLFAASNVLLMLAHALAAVSFYAVARYFRARVEWALAGATAFAFSPYLFYRSLDHLNLSFCWPIPPAILVVSWAFSRRGVAIGSRRFHVGLAIAIVSGLHNLYYAIMLAQFLLLAVLASLVRGRPGRVAAGPALLLLTLGAAMLADSANVLASSWGREASLAAHARPYGNLERYALKPVELVLPAPGWGLAPWTPLASAYAQGAIFRGEMGSAYLGLVGIAGLGWMCVSSCRGYLRRRRGFLPAGALAVAWILAFSVVGGINGILGTLGFTWLRGTNRYSVWILAVVLLWAVGRLSRAAWTRHRIASRSAALLVAVLAFADQRPPLAASVQVSAAHRTMASDEVLARSLETGLPPAAMIFSLPVVDCPEGARVGKATDYEHFRPYLFSRRLRFSYGSDKGRPREAWQRRVEALEPEAMAQALERVGFEGLLVNRKAFEDGAQELRARLAVSGRSEAWQSPDGDFLFVRLRPAARPSPPDLAVPEAEEARGTAP